MNGWIKLHRSLTEWEWYDDINVKVTFIHLLLSANHSNNKWRGIDIGRGQLWTSIGNLSKEVGLSEKQIRNCLKKLQSTNEISIKGASKGTMITVCKYDSYQSFEKDEGEQTDKRGANDGQAKGEQRATNNNDNNYKNEEELEEEETDFFPNEKLNDVFGKWLKMLAEKGKPMSPSSIEALQMKLNRQNVEYSIKQVNQSLENSWMTLQSVDDATKNNIGEPVNKISLNEVLVDINRSKYFDNEDFDYLFKKYLKMLAGQNLWIDEDGVKRMIARIKKMTILDASKKIEKYTRDRIFHENIDITTGKKTEFEEFKYHKDIIPL
jgi:predicted transcriptional regulator